MVRGNAVFARGDGPEFLEVIARAYGPPTAIAVETVLVEARIREIRSRRDELVDEYPQLKCD